MKNFSRSGFAPLILVLIVVGLLAIGGGAYYVMQKQAPPQQPINTGTLSEADARVIAQASCIKGGEALSTGTYNENSKTWWFDANLNTTREGCNPACVVSEETKQAEINWRCTGLITPTGTVVGNDKDIHGCIGSAGYSWCESKQKCLRPWEEKCEEDTGSLGCALETCHGLDVRCGPNPPHGCTEVYLIGDKCLRYAKCGVQNNKCQQIENPQFTQCKSCVKNCIETNGSNNAKLFECENACN